MTPSEIDAIRASLSALERAITVGEVVPTQAIAATVHGDLVSVTWQELRDLLDALDAAIRERVALEEALVQEWRTFADDNLTPEQVAQNIADDLAEIKRRALSDSEAHDDLQ